LLAQLPSEWVKPFKVQYLTRSYGRVYPDHSDPEETYDQVMKSDQISADLRAALQQTWLEYRKTYDAICLKMQSETDDWQSTAALTWSTDGLDQHNDLMRNWWKQRASKNEEFMQRFMDLLPEQILHEKAAVLSEWKELVRKNDEVERAMNPEFATFR